MQTLRDRLSVGVFCFAILLFLLMIPRSCLWGAEDLLPGVSDGSVTIELTIQMPPPVLVDKAAGLVRSVRQGSIEEWITGPAPRVVRVPATQGEHADAYVLVTLWAY